MKRILVALLALVLIMQFFRIDKTNPAVVASEDFIAITQPDAETTSILKRACYDCHSNTTVYPWYSNIAPVSWWLKHHVNEGREELNFSKWGSFSDKKKDHKLEECIELVKEGEMPLESYTWSHKEAVLTMDEKAKLTSFFSGLRK